MSQTIDLHPIVMATLLEQTWVVWIKDDAVTALWTVYSVLAGITFAASIYLSYIAYMEFLKLFPENTMEVIFNGEEPGPSPIDPEAD